MKIYTRKGDDGTTALLFAGKSRVTKDSPRPSAYGEGDEAVAALGVARAHCDDGKVRELLLRLQREMFVVNAELATAAADSDRATDGVTRVTKEMVSALEVDIDSLTSQTPPITDFVVPGGTVVGAYLDLATRVVRRAERAAVAILSTEPVSPVLLAYLNRLADLVWTIARYVERDTEWVNPRER